MLKRFTVRFSEEFGSGPVPKVTVGVSLVAVLAMALCLWAGLLSPTAEAAPAASDQGFVEAFEAPGVPTVYKYCDGFTTIYVTPATFVSAGGGPAITAVKNQTLCRK